MNETDILNASANASNQLPLNVSDLAQNATNMSGLLGSVGWQERLLQGATDLASRGNQLFQVECLSTFLIGFVVFVVGIAIIWSQRKKIGIAVYYLIAILIAAFFAGALMVFGLQMMKII